MMIKLTSFKGLAKGWIHSECRDHHYWGNQGAENGTFPGSNGWECRPWRQNAWGEILVPALTGSVLIPNVLGFVGIVRDHAHKMLNRIVPTN